MEQELRIWKLSISGNVKQDSHSLHSPRKQILRPLLEPSDPRQRRLAERVHEPSEGAAHHERLHHLPVLLSHLEPYKTPITKPYHTTLLNPPASSTRPPRSPPETPATGPVWPWRNLRRTWNQGRRLGILSRVPGSGTATSGGRRLRSRGAERRRFGLGVWEWRGPRSWLLFLSRVLSFGVSSLWSSWHSEVRICTVLWGSPWLCARGFGFSTEMKNVC